jgi:hypothetical protein
MDSQIMDGQIRDAQIRDGRVENSGPQFSLRQLFCWLTWLCAAVTVLSRVGQWMTDLGNVAAPAVVVLFLFVAVVILAQIVILRTVVSPLSRTPKS